MENQKIDIYVDQRAQLFGEVDEENDTIDNWDN